MPLREAACSCYLALSSLLSVPAAPPSFLQHSGGPGIAVDGDDVPRTIQNHHRTRKFPLTAYPVFLGDIPVSQEDVQGAVPRPDAPPVLEDVFQIVRADAPLGHPHTGVRGQVPVHLLARFFRFSANREDIIAESKTPVKS